MNKHYVIFYIVLTITVLFHFFPYGLLYFPYLDDYIAYGVTHYLLDIFNNPMELYIHYGMQTARPLAGLFDVLVAAPLWHQMWIIVLLMALLHTTTAVLINGTFKAIGLPHGCMLAAVFCLYPLLGESVYWVNAAVRIVPGFFLLFLSAYALIRYFKNGSGYYITAAAVAGLLSLGFYEQTVSVGFVLFFIIIWTHKKNGAWYGWPLSYLGLFGVYYAVFLQTGRMAARVSAVGFSWETFKNIGILLTKEQIYNIYSLLKIEIPRISFLHIGVCLLLAGMLAFLNIPKEKHNNKQVLTVICACALLLAAFGPFFILQNSFLTLRSVYFCLPVIAMLAQWAWDRLSRYKITAVFAGIIFALFLLLGIGSVNAFRINHQDDRFIADQIINILYNDNHPSNYRKVWLQGARYQFHPHGGVHLHSATLNDWSLSVLVNAYEFERFGERYISPDGGYFIFPAGEGDADAERDFFLTVDENARVR